ncbi:MAG: globin [Gammaproteobacteria bacterium]|nr:globin [Gammaproteobacteria bacterium]MBU1414696.1 globin [Gammaproteobacteria bacterium]
MSRSTAAKPNSDEAEVDLVFPSPPLPSPAVFGPLGEEVLRALVRHHHELLQRSSVGDLFPRDPQRFAAIVERIATFVVNSAGELPDGVQSRGLTWFRSWHLPLTIDETARNVWLAALLVAFDDVGFPDDARLEFWNWVEALSIRAITRRTMVGQPRRYPLAEAPEALRPFVDSIRRNVGQR